MFTMHNINYNQGIVLLLSIAYIYFLSDLFAVINNGPNIKLVTRLCIPIFGNAIVKCIDKISKFNVDFDEWWNDKITNYRIISYFFKILKWIQKNNIHLFWDAIMSFLLKGIFVYINFKIFYNFVMIFNYSVLYLVFSLLCSYSVYLKFRSSGVAMLTLCGKGIEIGSSIILHDHLNKIDDIKDYCKKNKDSWMTYILKIVIGYHGNVNIDGEQAAKDASEYVGSSYIECKEAYEKSIIKKMSSAIIISKGALSKIVK